MKFIKVFASILLVIFIVLALSVLGIVVTLNLTVLNPDFVIGELDTFDVYTIVFDEVKEHVPEVVPEEVLDDLFIQYKPWIEEQIHKIIYSSYSFIKEGGEFNIVISLESIKGSLDETIKEHIYEYLPPALQDAPESLLEPYISQIYQEIEPYIPDEIVLDEATVGTEVITAFEETRQVFNYVRLAYIIGLCVTVFSLLIIALLYRWRFKPFALYTGIAFTLAGVISIISAFLARSTIAGMDLLSGGDFMPEGFQEIVAQVIANSTQPLLYYGIGFVVAGAALLISSIFIGQMGGEVASTGQTPA
jgi:hypothetical protein